MSQPLMLKEMKLTSSSSNEDLQDLLELTPKKDFPFIIGDWNAKVGGQEIPEETGSLALEYKTKQGKGQQSFVKRTYYS